VSDPADQGNDQDKVSPELFGLFAEDKVIVDRLLDSVRRLIKRDGTTPEQVFHLAKLLHALQRLPLPTEGVAIELSLGMNHENGERDSQGVNLGETSLSLSTTRYVIICPSIGGDSECEDVFQVEVGGFRNVVDSMAVDEWLDAFDRRVTADQELEISDNSDSSGIDWGAESGEAYWDRLDSEYT
jgi:hypothetical protein